MSIPLTDPFLSTKRKLVQVIETLKEISESDSQPLKQVYGYLNKDPRAFPCAMVDTIEASGETRFDGIGIANATNKVDMYFVIHVELQDGNSVDITDQRLSLVDQISAKLRESSNVDTLGGTVERFDVISVVNFEIGSQDMKRLGFDMIVVCEKLMPVT